MLLYVIISTLYNSMQERMPSNIFEDAPALGQHIKVIHCLVSIIWRYTQMINLNVEMECKIQVTSEPQDIMTYGHQHPQWYRWNVWNEFHIWFFSNYVIFVNNFIFPPNHSNHCPIRDGSNPDAEVDGVKPLFGNWKAIFSRLKSSF